MRTSESDESTLASTCAACGEAPIEGIDRGADDIVCSLTKLNSHQTYRQEQTAVGSMCWRKQAYHQAHWHVGFTEHQRA
jgi:hypothetical protein